MGDAFTSDSTIVPFARRPSAEERQRGELLQELPFEKSVQANSLQVATWDVVEISFLSDERVQVRNGANSETHNYAELGFADDRNGKPNSAWLTLRDLQKGAGSLGRRQKPRRRGLK